MYETDGYGLSIGFGGTSQERAVSSRFYETVVAALSADLRETIENQSCKDSRYFRYKHATVKGVMTTAINKAIQNELDVKTRGEYALSFPGHGSKDSKNRIKALASYFESTGLVDGHPMDEANAKATAVLVHDGGKSAVSHMFTREDGSTRSYSEMRMMNG